MQFTRGYAHKYVINEINKKLQRYGIFECNNYNYSITSQRSSLYFQVIPKLIHYRI